jgi:hypothetical protein
MAERKQKRQRIEQQFVRDVIIQLSNGKSRLRDDMPPSVLRHICSFLNVLDVQSVRRSNKLHVLVPHWTVLELSDDELAETKIPLLKALELFAGSTERLTVTQFQWHCGVRLRFVPWTDVVRFLPRVRHLTTKFGAENNDEGRADLAAMAGMSKLETLEWLEGWSSIPVATLAPVMQQTRLRSLKLNHVLPDITDAQQTSAFFRQLPVTLSELRLTATSVAFGREQLRLLLSTCPELTVVQLEPSGPTARAMKPEDWSLLYSPASRVWREWTLTHWSIFADPLPCLGVDALDHFARAKVQHTLDIHTAHSIPWSSAMWKRFIEQTGESTSPLRVLRFGQAAKALDKDDDVGATLMECFPHLETLYDNSSIPTTVETIARAYERKWPLIYQHRVFPPPFLHWNIRGGDVKSIVDRAPRDHFQELYVDEDSLTPEEEARALPDILVAQRNWQDIHIDVTSTLTIPDHVAGHLARLPKLKTIYMEGKHVTLSTNALSNLLEHGDFEELVLLSQSNGSWTETPLSSELLRQLWRNPRRKTIALEHALVTGPSSLEWEDLAREWARTTTRSVTFRCLCRNEEAWSKAHNEADQPFYMTGSAMITHPRVRHLIISTD